MLCTGCVNLDKQLLSASRTGNTRIAQNAIRQGANVNAANKIGYTPLIEAASWGHTETVKLLLNAGANPNMLDNKGNTAAQAARSRHDLPPR